MRRIIFLLVSLSLFFVSDGLAHPPTDIDVAYDKSSGMLSVEVTHYVEDVANHYVKEIDVNVNGKQAQAQTFVNQAYPSKQVEFVDMELDEEAVITVNAVCNVQGALERKFDISGKEDDTDLYSQAATEKSDLLKDDKESYSPEASRELLDTLYTHDENKADGTEDSGDDIEYGYELGDHDIASPQVFNEEDVPFGYDADEVPKDDLSTTTLNH